MKRIIPILLCITYCCGTTMAQDLNDRQQGFTFTRNNHILTAKNPDGHVQTIDLDKPAFKGKAIAFTYSAKKKKPYQELEKMGSQVRVFPNPASESIKLELDGEWSFPVKMQLFDKNGNLIRSSNLETNESALDISQCNPGVYILQLNAKKAHTAQKLLVQ